MKRLAHALSLAGAIAVFAVVAPGRAKADPDYRKLFDNVTMSFRGFTGAAPGFGTYFVNGGDFHFGIEWSSFGIVVGGRFGAAGDDRYVGPRGARAPAAQLAIADLGCRGFLNPSASTGYYLGGGLGLGSTFVDGFAFSNAALYGLYAEGGVDLPRTSPVRVTAALRLDVGVSNRAQFSRVPDAGAVAAITINVGVLFGGAETGSEEP